MILKNSMPGMIKNLAVIKRHKNRKKLKVIFPVVAEYKRRFMKSLINETDKLMIEGPNAKTN